MVISQEARYIAQKTKTHIGLLYQFPEEVQKAIDEKRILIFKENGQIVAFCLWAFYGDWCEITDLYVEVTIRKFGYFKRVVEILGQRLKSKIKNVFLFTRHPAVTRMAKTLGMVQDSYFSLPWGVLFKIIVDRLKMRRLVSYLKFCNYAKKFLGTKMKIFILKKPA